MKKLLCLFGAVLLVLASCSNNDDNLPEPTPSSSNLVSKSTTTDNSSGSQSESILYSGKKIGSTTYKSGFVSKYTYTGDVITKIEMTETSGVLYRTIEYSYANGKLDTRIEKKPGATAYQKTKYTYNVDGTVSNEYSIVDALTGVEAQGQKETRKYTFKDGNLVKKENSGVITTYEYDTKKNPFANIVGLSLLFDDPSVYSANVNNVVKETYVSGSTNTSSTSTVTFTYKYNTNNLPTEALRTYKNGNINSIQTTQYSY